MTAVIAVNKVIGREAVGNPDRNSFLTDGQVAWRVYFAGQHDVGRQFLDLADFDQLPIPSQRIIARYLAKFHRLSEL